MPHAALARALAELGYETAAAEAAKRAVALSGGLSRPERLANEALAYELANDWDHAIEIARALVVFFPDDVEHALRLASVLERAGKPKDARETLDALRAKTLPEGVRARVDLADATNVWHLGEVDRALASFRAAASAAEGLGASHLLAEARYMEGVVQNERGNHEAALARVDEARRLFEASGDRGRAALAAKVHAVLLADTGDLATAERLLQRVLSSSREIGQIEGESGALADLLVVQKRQEDYAGALQDASELERLAFVLPRIRAVNLHNVGEILLQLGDFERSKTEAGGSPRDSPQRR